MQCIKKQNKDASMKATRKNYFTHTIIAGFFLTLPFHGITTPHNTKIQTAKIQKKIHFLKHWSIKHLNSSPSMTKGFGLRVLKPYLTAALFGAMSKQTACFAGKKEKEFPSFRTVTFPKWPCLRQWRTLTRSIAWEKGDRTSWERWQVDDSGRFLSRK